MMTLHRLIQRYGIFEKRVRQWTETWCGSYCSACRHVCCRAHYCMETRQSVFLAALSERFSPESIFSPTHGWLGQEGCTLVAGRPPVCYEFVCGPITDAVAGDPLRHHALLSASSVLTHVGKRAIGGRHIVEATRPADLQRVNADRFFTHLDQAEAAFDLAVDLLNGRQTRTNTALLSRIVSPPRK